MKEQPQDKDFVKDLRNAVRRVKSQKHVTNAGLAAILSTPEQTVSRVTVGQFLERGVQPRTWLLNRIIWWLGTNGCKVHITYATLSEREETNGEA